MADTKELKTIASFTIDHEKLMPGIYLSRLDVNNGAAVTTFDLRFTKPNREPVLDMPAVHTVEHLGATYLRNSERKDEIVYFGPMGCRTGFYLIVFGEQTPENVFPLVCGMCEFILSFEGDIPGAKPKECGNFSEQNLNMAKYYTAKYLGEIKTNKRFTYPD